MFSYLFEQAEERVVYYFSLSLYQTTHGRSEETEVDGPALSK